MGRFWNTIGSEQKGFALTEVLVAAGLMSLVMGSMISTTQILGQSKKSMSDFQDLAQLHGDLQNLFSRNDTCTDVLQGNPATGPVTVYKPGTSHTQILAQANHPVGGWTIQDLNSAISSNLGGGNVLLDISLRAVKNSTLSFGASERFLQYSVRATIDALSNLTGCSVIAGTTLIGPQVIYLSSIGPGSTALSTFYGVPALSQFNSWRFVNANAPPGARTAVIKVQCSEAYVFLDSGIPTTVLNPNLASLGYESRRWTCASGNNNSAVNTQTVDLNNAGEFRAWVHRTDPPTFMATLSLLGYGF